MPEPIRAQVILHTDDGVSENFVTNSWCISTTTFPTDSDLDDYTADFDAFYTSLSTYFGETVAQNGHEIKFYDLLQTVPPNYPFGTKTFALGSNPSTDTMPTEVALCLSFQGEKAPGAPQNRRRGRIYFGPVNIGLSSAGRPTGAFVTALAAAGGTLCTALQANSNPAALAVWSPTDGAAVIVTDGWVDNAWDTQRRRGIDRTSRTTFSA